MSFLFVVVIGAVAGYLAGTFIKGSELGVAIDFAAGAVGAIIVVFLSRLVGPGATAGFVMSAILAVAGAVAGLYAMRRFMKMRLVPVARPRRRR